MTKYIFLVFLLVGCYSHQKATNQHGRAVATFPDIGADYCARTYPPKDSLIKGDSVIVLDTIYQGGETFIDTVIVPSTDSVRVWITKTVQLPAKVVTRTVTIRDTVVKINTALLDACQIEKRKLTDALTVEQKRADKYQGQAKQRLWILLGIAGAFLVWLFFRLKRKKPK